MDFENICFQKFETLFNFVFLFFFVYLFTSLVAGHSSSAGTFGQNIMFLKNSLGLYWLRQGFFGKKSKIFDFFLYLTFFYRRKTYSD